MTILSAFGHPVRLGILEYAAKRIMRAGILPGHYGPRHGLTGVLFYELFMSSFIYPYARTVILQ